MRANDDTDDFRGCVNNRDQRQRNRRDGDRLEHSRHARHDGKLSQTHGHVPVGLRLTADRSDARTDEPVEAYDDVASVSRQELFVAERLRDGDHLAEGQPTETVDGVEAAPLDAHLLDVRQIVVHVPHVGRSSRAQSGADGHEREGGNEIGEREREHEQRRAIFAQLRVPRDHRDHERVEDHVQDDDSDDDDGF